MQRKILISFLLLVQFTFNNNPIYAQETYVSRFRSGHALSLFVSMERAQWSLSQNAGNTNEESISSVSQTKMAPAIFLRYGYHINIISNFGFFLGSTTGLLADQGAYGSLDPGYGIALPSVLAGLEVNMGQRFRVFGAAEYGAVWYPRMTVTTDKGSLFSLTPVPDMYVISGGLDYFYGKNTAFFMQFGWRLIQTTNLNNGSNNTYLNTLFIQNESYFTQLGLTWKLNKI